MKYSFKNDYSEGAHPNILKALEKTNFFQQEGYSDDIFCMEAEQHIKESINNPQAKVYFVSGGTQANLIIISSMLKSYESVICATSGHINIHEAGAIENTGHKINTIISKDGKITVSDIQSIRELHTDEHQVVPKFVYLSNSTELGTIYSKQELTEISKYCRTNQLLLFIDGARLGSALTSKDNDLTLSDIASLVDAFYIGGTKNGALIGEAIVLVNNKIQNNFRYYLKQKGALLSKSRLLGVQFCELFKDNLYFKLAEHSNKMAQKIVESFEKKQIPFFAKPQTNQIFPILSNQIIDKLLEKYEFYIWQKYDNETSVVRIVTSWATNENIINEFISDVEKYF